MLDFLQRDRATLTKILEDRRTVTTETMPVGLGLVWRMYLTILEDALATLNSLIQYLGRDDFKRDMDADSER